MRSQEDYHRQGRDYHPRNERREEEHQGYNGNYERKNYDRDFKYGQFNNQAQKRRRY